MAPVEIRKGTKSSKLKFKFAKQNFNSQPVSSVDKRAKGNSKSIASFSNGNSTTAGSEEKLSNSEKPQYLSLDLVARNGKIMLALHTWVVTSSSVYGSGRGESAEIEKQYPLAVQDMGTETAKSSKTS